MKTLDHHFWSEAELESVNVARERAYAALVINATQDLLVAAEDRGTNLAQLARIVGVSRSNLHHQLEGDRNMTLRTLNKIAFALGLSARVKYERRQTNLEPKDNIQPSGQTSEAGSNVAATTRHAPIFVDGGSGNRIETNSANRPADQWKAAAAAA